MQDLLLHTGQRTGGPRSAIKGARLSINGTQDGLRIALRANAPVGDFVSVAYSPSTRLLVIGQEQPQSSALRVRRDASEERTAYPVIHVSMRGSTPIKFQTSRAGAIDCELRQLEDGRLAIPVPEHFEHVSGEANG